MAMPSPSATKINDLPNVEESSAIAPIAALAEGPTARPPPMPPRPTASAGGDPFQRAGRPADRGRRIAIGKRRHRCEQAAEQYNAEPGQIIIKPPLRLLPGDPSSDHAEKRQ